MPDLDLSLQEIESGATFILSIQPDMDNIRGGIKKFGFGLDFDAPIRARIKGGANAPIRAGINAPFVDPPAAPLAVHRGQGHVFFGWGHPDPDKVDFYELYASLSLAGPYTKYPTGEFRNLRGTITGVPIGVTMYFQLRAVGKNGAESTFIQVKKGKFFSPLVAMKVRAIRGSKITNGAIFTSADPETGTLLAIRAPAEILIN